MQKNVDAFRTISEVAADLALPQHVLRFWETHFPQIKPLKRAGGRRYYRPADVLLLRAIRDLLHQDGYTIKGAQRLLRKQGAKSLRADGAMPANLTDADDGTDLDLAGEAVADVSASPVMPVSSSTGHAALRDALAGIEECERILSAVRRPLD